MGKLSKVLFGKTAKRAASLMFVLALIMTQMVAFSVSAEGKPDDVDVAITKELKVGDNVIVDKAYTFDFTANLTNVLDTEFDPELEDGDEGYIDTYEDVKSVSKSIVIDEDSPRNDDGNYVVDSDTLLDVLSGKYPHAGVYTYEVRETAGLETGVITYSQAKYVMRVYVKNHADGLYISNVTVEYVVDDNGDDVTPIKVDGENKPNDGTGNAFRFGNVYKRTTTLKISKTVTGEFADMRKAFSFTLALNKSSVDLGDTDPVYTGTIYDADDTPTGVTVSFTADGTASTPFQLKNGQYILLTGVSSGSTYAVAETGVTNFVPSVVITQNGVEDLEPTTGEAGQNLSTGTKNIGDGANIAAYTNRYVDPSITGIITNNLPFIILIGVGIVGITLFVIFRRRKTTD